MKKKRWHQLALSGCPFISLPPWTHLTHHLSVRNMTIIRKAILYLHFAHQRLTLEKMMRRKWIVHRHLHICGDQNSKIRPGITLKTVRFVQRQQL